MKDQMSSAEFRANAPAKKSKYKNVKCEYNGHKFDSKKEMRRYIQLLAMQQAGVISDLELQPVFDLIVNGVKVGVYKGDFRYIQAGECKTEDVKGIITTAYALKKRMVKAIYGVEIIEV